MYTVTIQLTDQEARVLRSYASVGRWFDFLSRFLNKIPHPDNIPKSDKLTDDIIELEDTIAQLKQPLSSFHQQSRRQLIAQGVKPLWRQLPQGDQPREGFEIDG